MHEKPVIIHLRATNFVGGPEKQIFEHFRFFKDGPYRFILCSFDEKGKPSSLHLAAQKLGYESYRLPSLGIADLRSIIVLYKILIQQKVKLLMTHGYKPNVIGRFASWLARIPTVAVSRGFTGENVKVKFYDKIDLLFYNLADHIVAVSRGQRDLVLQKGIREDKVTVIHNAIDVDNHPGPLSNSLRNELGVPEKALLVISAGRLSPDKLHLGLVQAAAQVCRLREDIFFAAFGEGFLRPVLESKVRELGLEGRFFLPGFRKDIRSLFHEMDIFVLPSFSEGLPNVVMESFACKKPVVATAVVGTPELVKNGETGFLVPAGDMDGMARAILNLASSLELRKRMGENGYQLIRNDFSFTSQTAKYMKLYDRLLGGKQVNERLRISL